MKTKELFVLLSLTAILLSVDIKTSAAEPELAIVQTALQNDTTTQNLSYEDETLINLFLNHVRLGNYEWALTLWEEISFKETAQLQTAYLRSLEETGQKDRLYEKYEALLQKYPDHEPALFWKAKFIFEKAEKEYQYELAKYQKDENTTTYAYLRRDLRRISEDYRRSRDILVELHKKNPSQRNYMVFLRNCYIRLEMQDDVARMNELLNR